MGTKVLHTPACERTNTVTLYLAIYTHAQKDTCITPNHTGTYTYKNYFSYTERGGANTNSSRSNETARIDHIFVFVTITCALVSIATCDYSDRHQHTRARTYTSAHSNARAHTHKIENPQNSPLDGEKSPKRSPSRKRSGRSCLSLPVCFTLSLLLINSISGAPKSVILLLNKSKLA